MAIYTLPPVDPVVLGDGTLLYDFNGMVANSGVLSVGDIIQTPFVKTPRGCKRAVFIKVADTNNADSVYLRGRIGAGNVFITPSFGQVSGAPSTNATTAATGNVPLQSPVCCTEYAGAVTLATSVPTSLQMVLAFCPA